MIRVVAFARYAELLGTSRIEMPLPDPPTIRAVLEQVRELPGGSRLPTMILVALNARQVQPGASVAPGDEVALLPPMAGG